MSLRRKIGLTFVLIVAAAAMGVISTYSPWLTFLLVVGYTESFDRVWFR